MTGRLSEPSVIEEYSPTSPPVSSACESSNEPQATSAQCAAQRSPSVSSSKLTSPSPSFPITSDGPTAKNPKLPTVWCVESVQSTSEQCATASSPPWL